MENLRTTIEMIFRNIPVEKTISDLLQEKPDITYGGIAFDELVKVMKAYMAHYSEDEIKHLCKNLIYEDRIDFYDLENDFEYDMEQSSTLDRLNVFELIHRFTDRVLVMYNGEIMCQYKNLLRWRMLSHSLDEDTFTTAFAAHQDLHFGYERKNFNWCNIIKSDNIRLKNLLQHGMGENHFHLKGSAPTFQLSWINLMNGILSEVFVEKNEIIKKLDEVERASLSPKLNYDGSKSSALYTLILKAALIRFFLFCKINGFELDAGSIFVTLEEVKGYLTYCSPDKVTIKKKEYNNYVKKKRFGISSFSRIQYPLRNDDKGDTKFIDIKQRFSEEFEDSVIELINSLWHDETLLNVQDEEITLLKFLRTLPKNQYKFSFKILKNLISEQDYNKLKIKYQQEFIIDLLNDKDIIMQNLASIYSAMEHYRDEYAYKFSGIAPDYAMIDSSVSDGLSENLLFHGERKLMYEIYKKLFDKNKKMDRILGDMFFAYLQIKIKFRAELIQSNNRIGFSNFADYQDRKTQFIDGNRFFEDAVVFMAVNDTVRNQPISSLEIRITPKAIPDEIARQILSLDRITKKKDLWEVAAGSQLSYFRPRYSLVKRRGCLAKMAACKGGYANTFYVFHFPKEVDKIMKKGDELVGSSISRHNEYRKKLNKWAEAIVEFRRIHKEVAKRVYGIDACSNELVCRPEVFAPIFRYLSNHTVSEDELLGSERLQPLRKTYHVGEDFFDIIDGLRSIEEAIRFLNLGQGDRLGHALALGVDVDEWYRKKNNRIELDKHTILDNLAWAYAKIRKYKLDGFYVLSKELEKKFIKYFYEVYAKDKRDTDEDTEDLDIELPYVSKKEWMKFDKRRKDEESCDIMTFYDAWKLRGDNPQLYSCGEYRKHMNPSGREKYDINKIYPIDEKIRKNKIATKLYYRYHYDFEVKKRGSESIEYEITEDYIRLTSLIQKAMQEMVNRHHIGIECNPSSNYLIGNLQNYIDHPIFNWYNMGLENDTGDCQQLFVSINTDDQGVFNTNLENEYALMAIALEKCKDENGRYKYTQAQIYKWIDHVRLMSLEQSFRTQSK